MTWGKDLVQAYFLVVWDDERNSDLSDIYGTRVNLNGTVLDPNGIVISNNSNTEISPVVAWEDNQKYFFVIWEHFYFSNFDIPNFDLYGTRVNLSGTVLDPVGMPIATSPLFDLHPGLSWNGMSFLIGWEQPHGNASTDIYGTLVIP